MDLDLDDILDAAVAEEAPAAAEEPVPAVPAAEDEYEEVEDGEEGELTRRQSAKELEDLREKARKRAERFGVAYVEPESVPEMSELTTEEKLAARAKKRLEVLKERREAECKKEERAKKYGNSLLGLTKEEAEREEAAINAAEAAEAFRRKQAARFASVPAAVDYSDLFADFLENPMPAIRGAEARPECVYLYGCDTLSTSDCLSYFRDYSPVFVEWINDSSCVVVFADAFSASRALTTKGEKAADPAAAAPAPMDADGGGEPAAEAEEGEIDRSVQWYAGPPFAKADGLLVPLSFRAATTADVKLGHVQSRYLWDGAEPRSYPGDGGGGGRKRRRQRPDHDGEAPEGPDLRLQMKRKRRDVDTERDTERDAPVEGDVRKMLKAAAPTPAERVAWGRALAMDAHFGGALESIVPDFGNDLD